MLRFKLQYILIVFFLLLVCVAHGQSFDISGDIKDQNNEAVYFANVILLEPQDSTTVSGTLSDVKGTFVLTNTPKGQYILKTSYIGFKDSYMNININDDINIGTIVLDESIEPLNEVELIVKKPTLQREADRLVFNVENSSLSESNTLQILKSTPGVLVLDGDIKVKNSSPTIYINNRKVNLSTEEVSTLLEGTPGSNVKAVEVITNPSAKYDAESGIVLNIIMSKNLITGYRGSIFTNYTQGVFPKMDYGTTNFFKSKKINLFSNYTYSTKKIDRVNRETVFYPAETWTSNTDRNIWSETHNVSLNLDYDINDANTLSFATQMSFLPYFKYVTKNRTDIDPFTTNSISYFLSNNLSRDTKQNLAFDFDYKLSFKNTSQLRFNSHITTFDHGRDQNTSSNYFLIDNSFFDNTAFNTNSNQKTNIFSAQLDYELPLADTSVFELGTKFTKVNTESDITQNDIIGGVPVLDRNNSDAFQYNEEVYAAYANYTTTSDKWDINFGLRVEQTNINGESILNETNTQDYLEWFPNVSISHQISESLTLYSNYKRSIQRADYNDLNPFRFFLNDNTIVTGNPNLNPVFNNHYVFGLSINENFTFEAYYSKSEDYISEIPIQDETTNILTYTPLNINHSTDFGFDFAYYLDITPKWSLYAVTSFYNIEEEFFVDKTNVNLNQWSNYSELSTDLFLLKDNSLTANFTATYVGKNLQGLRVAEGMLFTDLSFRKTIFNKKGILSLAFSDLFNEQQSFARTKFLDQDNQNFNWLDNRYVKVGFRYRFGNTTLETNQNIKEREERDRLKDN